MCIQEKMKMWKFPEEASAQKSVQNFFANFFPIWLLLLKAFQRAIKY